MSKLTDWELGNDILYKVMDEMQELAFECSKTHPEVATQLRSLAITLGKTVNDLMEPHNGCRMAVEDESN